MKFKQLCQIWFHIFSTHLLCDIDSLLFSLSVPNQIKHRTKRGAQRRRKLPIVLHRSPKQIPAQRGKTLFMNLHEGAYGISNLTFPTRKICSKTEGTIQVIISVALPEMGIKCGIYFWSIRESLCWIKKISSFQPSALPYSLL